MSNNQNQSSNQEPQSQQTQSDQQSSTNEGQRRSAPEYPPATPKELRTNSANFGEHTGKDRVDL